MLWKMDGMRLEDILPVPKKQPVSQTRDENDLCTVNISLTTDVQIESINKLIDFIEKKILPIKVENLL